MTSEIKANDELTLYANLLLTTGGIRNVSEFKGI